jgi:hypothetical protein
MAFNRLINSTKDEICKVKVNIGNLTFACNCFIAFRLD